MGLDCSHDAFHGAYSAFNSFRQAVAHAIGGSYPTHWLRNADGSPVQPFVVDQSKEEGRWYWGEGYSQKTHPGLYEFFCHSDCDGEITPDMCKAVADELEPLLDKMPEQASGHIAGRGGYRQVLQYFIDGCRAAHAKSEPLNFH